MQIIMDFIRFIPMKRIGRTGYNLEKWHWSYLPLASKYLEFYNKKISYTMTLMDLKGTALTLKK